MTPMVMMAITEMSLISGFSKRKKNAKIKTNPKLEDLQSANINNAS